MVATIETNMRCTGCGVCAHSSPVNSIKMGVTDLDFINPILIKNNA